MQPLSIFWFRTNAEKEETDEKESLNNISGISLEFRTVFFIMEGRVWRQHFHACAAN